MAANPPRSRMWREHRVVQQRQAIPQHVAARRLQQECALSDAEPRLGLELSEAGLKAFDAIAMGAAQRIKRGPLLAVEPYELPLFLADFTMPRRVWSIRVLRAAGDADVAGHV